MCSRLAAFHRNSITWIILLPNSYCCHLICRAEFTPAVFLCPCGGVSLARQLFPKKKSNHKAAARAKFLSHHPANAGNIFRGSFLKGKDRIMPRKFFALF